MDVVAASSTNQLWGDMYAVMRLLYNSPLLSTKEYYFQTIKGNNFVRPSFLIKMVDSHAQTRTHRSKFVELEMLITYHSYTQWDALEVGEVVSDLLSGWPQAILPKWDFTNLPPIPLPISGYRGPTFIPHGVGIRVDPDSVSMNSPIETPDELWETPITFTMRSSRNRVLDDAPIITAVNYQLLFSPLMLPQILEVNYASSSSVTIL